MVFNPNTFSRLTRMERVNKMADNLGFDQDDFANDKDHEVVQRVISAKEFAVESSQKPNWMTPEIPQAVEAVYTKVGLDEYRVTHKRSKGIEELKDKFPPLGATIDAMKLFEINSFALKEMPAIYEDEYGNIWTRGTKNGA